MDTNLNKKNIRRAKIRWLKSLIKDDINLLIGSVVLGLLASILGLIVAIFSQKLIDEILPSGRADLLMTGIFTVTGILILKQALVFGERYLGIRQNRDFNLRLINRFYSSLLRLPKVFFDRYKTGELTARMDDTEEIQQTIAFIVNTLIINVLVLIVSGIVLFFYSVKVGLIAVSALPAFILISLIYRKKLFDRQDAVMEANAQKESNYIVTIQNVEIIKGSNKEELFSKINNSFFGFYQQEAFKLGKIGISLGNIAELTGTLIFLILLTVISFMTINKSITIGEFAAILGIASGMLPAMAIVAFSHLQLVGANVAFNRMYELISLDKEYELKIDEKKDNITTIDSIRVESLSFSYGKEYPVLNNVCLQARKGEIICIFGENGTGKSTILNLIQGFYKPEKGTIYFNEKGINDLSIFHLRNSIAYVTQKAKLFNTTILENISLEEDYDLGAEAIPYLNALGFDKYFESMPDGYATVVNEGGSNLSGGQLQLIAFARALYKKPQLLLLDEPSASMDTDTEKFIMNLLSDFKKNGIVILVTHRLKPAKLSDRVYVLKNGVIDSMGTHTELLSTANLYSKSFAALMNE